MTAVKICGLVRLEDIFAVNRHRPDFAGFVFAPGRRRLNQQDVARLTALLDGGIVPAGVFADERAEAVAATARACRLGAVQLHGGETNEYIAALRALLPPGVLVFKAIRVRDASSLEQAERAVCDLLVLDAYADGALGGTGRTFDWSLLRGFPRPFLLAGGLNADNVAEAVAMLQPYGVDVSSGVETEGRKDEAKIMKFLSLARSETR